MKYLKAFCSFRVTAILALIYIIAMAAATFIESDAMLGTPVAREVIYNASWFDVLHLLLALNLIGIFVIGKLYKSKKYHVLILHAAFVVILVGAGLTRYFGFEGVMHIREGYTSDVIISNEEYINITAGIDNKIYQANFPVSYTAFSETHFHESVPLFDEYVGLNFISYTTSNGFSLPELRLTITYKDETKELVLYQSFFGFESEIIQLGDADFEVVWGPKETKLPFTLYLESFELERYAGSVSPSSYASNVIIKDGDISMPFRIFMNNVLDYRGYRFFQSSYDQDERGTILSVNKDPGKIPTYIGYALLVIGFLWGFFAKNGRFHYLAQKCKSQNIFGIACAGFFLCYATNAIAYPSAESSVDSAWSAMGEDFINFDEAAHGEFFDFYQEPTEEDILRVLENMRKNVSLHAKKLGTLQVQGFDGRIKPLDTFAMEMIHKITRKDKFFELNHTELLLGMMMYYDTFQRLKMFATDTQELREILGAPIDEKYVSFLDAFDSNYEYKLKNYIEEANRKDPSKRSMLDKDIIKFDEKINIAWAIFKTDIFVVFPNISDNPATWLYPDKALEKFDIDDVRKVTKMLENYFIGVHKGVQTNMWDEANNALYAIKNFQKEHAPVSLSDFKVNMEIWLNHYNPFKNLMYVYLCVGLVLLVFSMNAIMRAKIPNIKATRALYGLVLLLLVIHTLALVIRWYVGGHAPWSNAYETMIYIAWAGMIAGGVFFRRSTLALSMATLMAGITLFVAHLGYMDPQISPLVPVLKSYWLNIHVSVITASYGFFGFSFMLGIITLVLFAIYADSRAHLKQVIVNLSYINEMSLLLGLAFLTIGNFLGGVWANESWGRYWGWDSKETWSLITIVAYALILHVRFIAKRNYAFVLSALSMVGFYFVLMTYFGVNFYLTGKHSYASGEPVPIPIFVYVLVCGTIALIFMAARNRKLS